MKISILCLAEHRVTEAEQYARQGGYPFVEQASASDDYVLIFGEDNVRLHSNHTRQRDILVDFCAGSAAHRRKFGGGKGQLIARAVGIKGTVKPQVFDMTAGLGGDAFVLASLGCQVTMLERNPVVHALLADGLTRARQFGTMHDPALSEILARLCLHADNSIDWLQRSPKSLPVVYLDPMFPERKKSARVKKEMQVFHGLVGEDEDAADLLEAALRAARNRVVVKRPRIAPSIGGMEPSYRLEGRSSRYDIYALKSLDS